MGNGRLKERTCESIISAKVALAKEMTGIKDTDDLMNAALDALIQREAARRLRLLDGESETPSLPAD